MDRENYDVAVVGGGIAAVFHACAMAEQGRKVILLAETTSLMHEIGLSRLPLYGAAQLAEQYPLVRAWLDLLEAHGGIKEERLEPILTQLLADVFVQSYDIDVLFEVMPVGIVRKEEGGTAEVASIAGVRLATREGFNIISCPTIVDCTDNGMLIRGLMKETTCNRDFQTFWTLTCLQQELPVGDYELTVHLEDTRFDVRLSPSYWEGEITVEVAVSSSSGSHSLNGEIGFAKMLEQLLDSIRKQSSFGIGPMLHVSERSWSTPVHIFEPATESRFTCGNGAWLATGDGTLAGIGCWTLAGHRLLSRVSLWDKGGVALRFLTEGAIEAANR